MLPTEDYALIQIARWFSQPEWRLFSAQLRHLQATSSWLPFQNEHTQIHEETAGWFELFELFELAMRRKCYWIPVCLLSCSTSIHARTVPSLPSLLETRVEFLNAC